MREVIDKVATNREPDITYDAQVEVAGPAVMW